MHLTRKAAGGRSLHASSCRSYSVFRVGLVSMHSFLRRLLFVLIVVSATSASFALAAPRLARKFVFPTDEVEIQMPPHDVVSWTLKARDGALVHALQIRGPAGAPVFVYFHNNRQTMVDGVELGRELVKRGFGVVLAEYRGYGLSKGREPSEEGLYLDAEAVLDALSFRGIGADRIVLWGTSLGTGVAAEMARRGRGSALVLVTPYTSLPDVVTAVVPMIPANALMPDRFETFTKLRDIRCPTLVIHGDADEIVPFRMGQQIANAHRNTRLLRVAGGHHGDLFARERERLLTAMAATARATARE